MVMNHAVDRMNGLQARQQNNLGEHGPPVVAMLSRWGLFAYVAGVLLFL